MKINLIGERLDSIKHTIFHNRGIGIDKLAQYTINGVDCIESPLSLGEQDLKDGLRKLAKALKNKERILVIVDSDVDGFTSASILMNYLYRTGVKHSTGNIDFALHDGKQHGLTDMMETIIKGEYKLVLSPDGGSNNFEEHEALKQKGIELIVLDHHETEFEKDYPFTIINNNKIVDGVKNKCNPFLSGAAIVYKFCKYIDSYFGWNFADEFKDLVSLGVCADMMDVTNIETKQIIFQGLKQGAIKNPFISEIATANSFQFKKDGFKPSIYNELEITPIASSFYISPIINAICREGTLEEKSIVFKGLLEEFGNEMVISNKRGAKGELEKYATQAVRTAKRVKDRQKRETQKAMEVLEPYLEEGLKHNALIIFLEDGGFNKALNGLIANKFAEMYQRPCIIAEKTKIDGKECYSGSARGYKTLSDFKETVASTGLSFFQAGHPNAFGVGVEVDKAEEFVKALNKKLEVKEEIVYDVDYIFDADELNEEIIYEFEDFNDYIGKNFERPQIYVQNITYSSDNFKEYNKCCKIEKDEYKILIWTSTIKDGDLEKLKQGGTINIVCNANRSEYQEAIYPQLTIIDYEIVQTARKFGTVEVEDDFDF